jgi:hypothetical protein
MTPTVEHAPATSPSPSESALPVDLPSAIRHALAASDEPMTVSKIKAALPSALRQTPLEELNEVLRKEAAANRLHEYPKYRSQQERYWDRPMPVHLVHLLRVALEEKPMPWSELRRKLPAYAQEPALEVLEIEVREERMHRHPRQPGKRAGEPFGIRPADPKDYLRQELSDVFNDLEKLGFKNADIRAAALDILHDEEWAPTPPETKAAKEKGSAPAGDAHSPQERPESNDSHETTSSSAHHSGHATAENAASHSGS